MLLYEIMNMSKLFLLIGIASSGLSVIIGAFGAHGLSDLLTRTERTETFETAVKYQFYHSLGLILIGILFHLFSQPAIKTSAYLMLIGMIIFSGSLYILCLTNVSKWGAVTPVGGLILIIAWGFLFMGVLKTSF